MNKVFIPISIIIAGLIVAGAVVLTNNAENVKPAVVENERPTLELAPITDDDYILGNPDAEVLLVEYSDFQCPYCAMFHGTMKRLVEEYGDSGQFAWVYRHFPISSHQTARPLSEASECVANLGGKDKFWSFTDEVFSRILTKLENKEQDYSVKAEEMRDFAISLGIEETSYDTCITEKTYAQDVENDYQDGLNIAKVDENFGTPYNILITKEGVKIPIPGNQPYASVKNLIDAALANGSE
jgi:protein-disulfide isomerase